VVEPVAVIQSRGNFYLTAYCRRVDAERTFRVDKIKEISTAGNSSSRAALI
jgi:predicted DNA-binding transcriptional regulator YafY